MKWSGIKLKNVDGWFGNIRILQFFFFLIKLKPFVYPKKKNYVSVYSYYY